MDAHAYLNRIDYIGGLTPTAASLRGLQLAHLVSVPFENLSIHAHEPIVLSEDALFEKIVLRRRGGFCYELNGLFAALLRQLGFKVTMLSAGVATSDSGFGPDFDHMALMVRLADDWLVDVGFGDCFREPLLLHRRDAQPQGERAYRIADSSDYLILNETDASGEWKAHYRFTLQPRQLADYTEMCHYHQTSPDSHFTQRSICSMATPDGRVTLSDMRFIETTGAARRERVMSDEEEYSAYLKKYFSIEMRT